MKRYIATTALALLLFSPAYAQSPIENGLPLEDQLVNNLSDFSSTAGIDGSNPANIATPFAIIINTALALSGSIFVALIVYAGYLWLLSAGSEERVKKAKDIIKHSVIGIIILIAGYTISYFALQATTEVFSNYGSSGKGYLFDGTLE